MVNFFRESMLDFVALAERPEVAARLDTALASATDLEGATTRFYQVALTDLLTIAQDEKVVQATEAVLNYWKTGEGDLQVLGETAWVASHTGAKLLGPDQRALDKIVARAAARSTGVVSNDPEDTQNFGKEYDTPDHALGNIGMLAMLGMGKDPSFEGSASLLPPAHLVDGKLNVATFTKARAMRASDMAKLYIDKFINCL